LFAVLCRLYGNLFVHILASPWSEQNESATIHPWCIGLERTFNLYGGRRSRHIASLHTRPQLSGAVK
jgi:hypothetical protein